MWRISCRSDTWRKPIFSTPEKIQQLRHKALQPSGRALSERENMALVGIISTQLLDEKFVRNFPSEPSRLHKDLKIYHQNAENRLN